LNLYAISLLSKYARNTFAKQLDLSSHPEQERFGLINLSSIATVVPFPNMTQYSGTKRYDNQLTNSIRDSCYKKNIDCLIVNPGIVSTGMTDNAKVAGSSCLPEHTVAGSLAQLGLLNHTYGSTVHTFFALQCHGMIRPYEHMFKLWFGPKYNSVFELYQDMKMMK